MEWIVAGSCLAIVAICLWKRALVSAEMIKVVHHPFLYVALALILIGIPLKAELSLFLGDYRLGTYRSLSAFLVFALGAGFGVKLAVFVTLIFSALSFAGEFDRGTIKVILTRPATRTEIYLVKCAAMLLLALGVLGIAVFESLLWGLLRGDLGHVWKMDGHEAYPFYSDMVSHLNLAVGLAVASVLATVFLGVVISTLTESSGHAVAVALIFLFVLDMLASYVSRSQRLYFFNFYPGYGFAELAEFARGSAAARWDERVLANHNYALVPAVTSAVLGSVSYALFRWKNVNA
jgi:ABC-type transport system involved in multi-copper enzyme maturation permease subunit